MSKSPLDSQLFCLLHFEEFGGFGLAEGSREERKEGDVTDWGGGGVK